MEEVAAALGQAALDVAVAVSVALLRDVLAMWLSGAAADEKIVGPRQAVPEASNRDRNKCNRWHGQR